MRGLVGWIAALACAACGARAARGPLANQAPPPPPGPDVVLVHHAWTPPVPLPDPPTRARLAPRPATAPPGPTARPAPSAQAVVPTVDDRRRQIALLQHLAATSRGRDRLDALARIADLTGQLAHEAPGDAAAREGALEAGAALIAEPGFAAMAHADTALFAQADLLMRAGRPADARKVLFRLIKAYPASARIPDAYVAFGDYFFEQADLAGARPFYEKALQFPAAPVAAYARYKLAWVHFDLGEYQDALAGFVEVAASAPPPLGRAAADDAVRVYAQIGRADRAIAFFERVDRARAIELAEALGRAYLDLGRAADAVVVLHAAAARQTDPARACADRVAALGGVIAAGRRPAMLDEATAVAGALAGDACRADADATIGELAMAWQVELPKSEADPADAMRLWEIAGRVATTPARRAAAARNRALVAWQRAEAGGGRLAGPWADAAEAAQAAVDVDGAAADLADRAVDAWGNAVLTARTGGVTGDRAALRARIRAGLERARQGPAAGRATALLAALR